VLIHGRPVWFWSKGDKDRIWWRDEAHQPGDACGYCGVPSSALLFARVAERVKGKGKADGSRRSG
jgi:hypothetical protein